MNDTKITLWLNKENHNPPGLVDFAKICNALKNCIANISRCLANQELDYQLTGLKKGSALLEFEPLVHEEQYHLARDISETFTSSIRNIEQGLPVDPRLDYRTYKAFNEFATVVSKGKTIIQIRECLLTQQFSVNMDAMLKPILPAMGSVSGKLDAITVHNKNRFTLYPAVRGEEVQCTFNKSDLNKVLKAIGQKVIVYGKLFYARNKSFPVQAQVDSFEIEPDDSELSDLLDCKGITSQIPRTYLEGHDYNEWE